MISWSELHALAREKCAEAIKADKPMNEQALAAALRILELGMVTPKDIKEKLNG